jgi:hypothetical protein
VIFGWLFRVPKKVLRYLRSEPSIVLPELSNQDLDEYFEDHPISVNGKEG